MNDLEQARPGDIFTRDGVDWVCIAGPQLQVSLILQRADAFGLSTSEHTRHAVIPASLWAGEWKATGREWR